MGEDPYIELARGPWLSIQGCGIENWPALTCAVWDISLALSSGSSSQHRLSQESPEKSFLLPLSLKNPKLDSIPWSHFGVESPCTFKRSE